ncbi:MAG: response regulator, partial [Bacteroidales bacterium]|nr:response regulator [Bacteroidales bacterium]
TLSYAWFINAGSSGPVSYVLILASIVYIVLTRGANRVIAVSVVFITITLLFVWEYLHPEIIIQYSDVNSKFFDIYFTALFSLGLIAFIVSYIMNIYHDEREMVIKQRDQIIKQNEEIKTAEMQLIHQKDHLEETVKKRTKELEETNIQLIKAKEKAEESDRLKTAFLSNMSHEIRTPMNAIIGFADLLRQPKIQKETHDNYIDIITGKGNLLMNIINDIIDISKVEADKIEIIKGACKINEMLDELFLTFHKTKTLAGKSEVDLRIVKPEKEKEVVVFTDPFRLKQIISNLIDNALKFTHKGYVEIGYSILKEKNKKNLKFYVKDTGIGISADKLDIIFKRFRQIEDSHTREFGGTGLGLSISKKLVELLEGDIKVESEIDKGSTFSFEIPYIEVEITEIPSEIKTTQKKSYNWKSKVILIAEDNLSSLYLLKNYLGKTKCKIIHTKSGKEAVEICTTNKNIDLVLMDIQLPEMNGYDATRLIKEIRKDLPIIAQTAYAMAEDAVKSYSAGCDDYLAKPVSKDKLLSVMSNYLD